MFAYKGRMEMFQMLFGSREKEAPPKRAKAADIKRFAKTHNLLVQTGKVKLPKKKKAD